MFHVLFCLLNLILYIPVNIFSVMLGRVILGWTSTKQLIKCLAQGHNTAILPGSEALSSNPSNPSLTLY